MNEHKIKHQMVKFVCPYCNRERDQVTGDQFDNLFKPEPEDIVVCRDCAEVAAFDDDLQLKKLDPQTKLADDFLADIKKLKAEVAKEIAEKAGRPTEL
jgi:hypothetical protein